MPDTDATRAYALLLLHLGGGLSAALVAQRLTVDDLARVLTVRDANDQGKKLESTEDLDYGDWTKTLRRLLCGDPNGWFDLQHLAKIEEVLGFDVWEITAAE